MGGKSREQEDDFMEATVFPRFDKIDWLKMNEQRNWPRRDIHFR